MQFYDVLMIIVFFVMLQALIIIITQDIDKLPLFIVLDNILWIFGSTVVNTEITQKIFLCLVIGITVFMAWVFITERVFDSFSVRRIEIKNKNFPQAFKQLFLQELETLLVILIATISLFYIKKAYVNFRYIAMVSYIMANIGIIYALLLFVGVIYSSSKYNEKIVNFAKLVAGKKLTNKIQNYNKKNSDSKIRLKDFVLKSNKDEVKKFIEKYVEKIDDDEIEYIESFSDISCDNGVFPLKDMDYLMRVYDFMCTASKEEFSDKESDNYKLGISYGSLFWGGVGYFMGICRCPNTEGSHDFVGRNSLSLAFFINCVVKEDLSKKDISEIVGLGVLQTAFFKELNKA